MRDLRSRLLRTAAVVSLLIVAWRGAAGAQEGDADLRAALEERFSVQVLRGGLLLEPREPGAGPGSIEVGADGFALDGLPVAADELEARLGEPVADLLREAAALSAAELRNLFLAAPAVAGDEPGEEGEPDTDVDVSVQDDISDGAGKVVTYERDEKKERRVRRDTQVVVGDSVIVEENEVSDDVVVVGGSLEVLGEVRGDAVAVGGSIEVTGEVSGDVAAIGGTVELAEEARVQGDVIAVGGSVERAEGAQVGGKIVETPFGPKLALGTLLSGWKGHEVEFRPWERWVRLGWKFFWVVFLGLLAMLALLVARRPIDRMDQRVEREPWRSGLIGLLAQALFVPLLILVVIVLCISIIGIPLLLLLPFALLGLVLVGVFGFAAVVRRVGAAVEARFGTPSTNVYLQAMAGITVVYAAWLVGHLLNTGPFPLRAIAVMIIVLGTFAWYAAWTVGFGAAILTRFGSAASWQRAAPPPPPGPSPPQGGAEGGAPAPELPPATDEWADDEVERQ